MALKPQRIDTRTSLNYFAATTGTAGQVVYAATGTAPRGQGLDDSNMKCGIRSDISGLVPVGILLTDVVSEDLTQVRQDVYGKKAYLGGKVAVMTQGVLVTNELASGAAPATGVVYPTACYALPGGKLTHVAAFAASGFARVGTFLTGQDADGYAQVAVNVN